MKDARYKRIYIIYYFLCKKEKGMRIYTHFYKKTQKDKPEAKTNYYIEEVGRNRVQITGIIIRLL